MRAGSNKRDEKGGKTKEEDKKGFLREKDLKWRQMALNTQKDHEMNKLDKKQRTFKQKKVRKRYEGGVLEDNEEEAEGLGGREVGGVELGETARKGFMQNVDHYCFPLQIILN
jgi:hypothetical protein